jgi:septum formation protein
VILPPLILASASPRRAELLKLLKVKFRILPGEAHEVAHEHLSPLEVCQLNAHRKARAIAKKFLDGEIFGKPRNLADARRMLAMLQGRTHQVVTGVCLMHLRVHRERIFAVSTDVLFHPLDGRQVRDYLAKINPLDKAGAYAIQDSGELIISEISGSYSNVVGLPVERLASELKLWAAS